MYCLGPPRGPWQGSPSSAGSCLASSGLPPWLGVSLPQESSEGQRCVAVAMARELPQLPALQVRMEEEDGVEEEEEVEEEVDHAEEGTFDLDFGPLLGEILQVD